MTDVVDTETRSRMMSGIRGKNTKPELLIRSGLHKLGFRFRLHNKKLPGTPDLAFPTHKAVILVNGCFWHGHNCPLFKWPKSRAEFWKIKISQNKIRDIAAKRELRKEGWRVLVIWECAIKRMPADKADKVIEETAAWLLSQKKTKTLRGSRTLATKSKPTVRRANH